MGTFEVTLTIYNPADRARSATVGLLVDTRPTLSWIPRTTLEAIGITPEVRRKFLLADGRRVERDTGIATMTLDGVVVGVTVVFAEPAESSILGATALEALGVTIDPVGEKLLPRDLMALGASAPDMKYSLNIEATRDPNFFGFCSLDLEGFTGVGNSVEDCLYKARWGMAEHVSLLRERGLPVPPESKDPKVTIQNAGAVPARVF
jgi:predicted aspartyl protease/predicted RNase H-like HicB family nuclease